MNFPLIKSTKGFCTIQTILFIGIFATLLFCFGFLSFAAQAKMQYRTTCLVESIKLQKEIILAEKKLFALNPLSTALQLKYDLTAAELVVALSVFNYPAAFKLEADLIKIQADQLKLDRLQKMIISTAQLMIVANTLKIESTLKEQALYLSQRWNFFLLSFFIIHSPQLAQVSVQTRTSGIAPNYELKDSYMQDQKVAFIWQMKYLTKNEKQKLVKSKNSFEMSCQAKPK